ncbi:metallophosphoesterase [Simiduia curdlanivorans]|uniref:Metallophosphoesterase n=1 Tax=Simiduia curdlanivorans TaxID=1492769 RepID=A0ABV8V6B6_9GAMM|nr:metallophosphoesterase [Simiduia curdlanivorans]MDN3640788.1 metallophosphoesterase [Simiduia curdlanivorans]
MLPTNTLTIKTKLCLAAALVCSLLASWAFWFEPSSIRVVEHELRPTQWPTHCDGLRVAVLADLHLGSPFNGLNQLQSIVELTNQAKPDIILLAGDYVIQGVLGGSFVAPEDAAKILAHLKASAGVYAVLGNHDWWLESTRVGAALQNKGITLLEDANQRVNTTLRHVKNRTSHECQFNLVGISDFWEGAHDIETALTGIDTQIPTLAFTHNPDIFPLIPEQVTLTIAGHTHGGQVYLPFIGRPIVPSAYGETYAIGAITEQRSGTTKHLFVSPGIGTSILPVRFLVPPEISVLTLLSPVPHTASKHQEN